MKQLNESLLYYKIPIIGTYNLEDKQTNDRYDRLDLASPSPFSFSVRYPVKFRVNI